MKKKQNWDNIRYKLRSVARIHGGKPFPDDITFREDEKQKEIDFQLGELGSNGYVYVICSNDDSSYYKIGWTSRPDNRFDAFDRILPHGFKVIALIKCIMPQVTEKMFHEKFASKRIKGEWFELNEEDINYLKSYEDEAA